MSYLSAVVVNVTADTPEGLDTVITYHLFLASGSRHLFPTRQNVDLTSPETEYLFLCPKGVLTTQEFVIHLRYYLKPKNI